MMTLLDILPMLKEGKAKKRGRKPKIKSIKASIRHEKQYTKDLLEIASLCEIEGQKVMADLKASSNGYFVGDAAIGDAPKWANNLALSFGGLKSKVAQIANTVASKFGKGQAYESDKLIAAQIEAVTGVDVKGIMPAGTLSKQLETAITANVSLINSLPAQYQRQLESIILTSLQNGKGADYIEAEILKLGESTKKRARLIARDQAGKLTAQFSKERQIAMGFKKYVWITRRDKRVRGNPSGRYPNTKYNHWNRDLQVFSWDDPPPDGHAGEPFQCRCYSSPDIDDLLMDDPNRIYF